ncbi:MAG TPA: tetratricopeptide repeat protein [Pyrinomonadaceae bacterium]|nr:tetratricopeptide repeat protein [Pyrinomonadaceae bacterium]
MRTKNFLLVGNAGEKDIRKVGLKLEQFREVFTRLFPKMTFNTPVPTTVVVFKSKDSYEPFMPRANTVGYFQPGPDVNYITLTTEVRAQDPFSVIFHEYTHLLIENSFKDVPLWFNEGLAEYYSTVKISDDQKVAIGTAIGPHVFLLRESTMLPLKTLFEVDHKSPHYNETQKQGIFYAQSWALMHYLIIGKVGKVEQLGKFMELLGAKVPVDQAFPQAFGVPFEVMEKELREYVKKDRYNVLNGHFEKKLELDTEAPATPLTEAEAQAYLGDLMLHSNFRAAHSYLEKALRLDPNLAMAHASLGMAYFREGNLDKAQASLERAIAGNSQNYLTHYYYALVLSGAETGSVTSYPADVVTKIREHLQKAITLRPDYPESYKLMSFVSLVTGERVDESIVAVRSVLKILPGRHDFINMLAQLYLRKNNVKTARLLLEEVTKSNASEENRKEAESLLKHISTYEESLARVEEAKKLAQVAGSQPVIVSSGANHAPQKPADPSSYLREVLRKPEAGETQLQAKLVKIECDVKGIVFVVQTATGLLRLRTEKFENIVITTYDPKVAGEITCGPWKAPAAVVVCYVPGANSRAKVDGVLKSVEFVPAEFKL